MYTCFHFKYTTLFVCSRFILPFGTSVYLAKHSTLFNLHFNVHFPVDLSSFLGWAAILCNLIVRCHVMALRAVKENK